MKKALLVFLIIFSHILYAQSDCQTAMAVCGNSNISYTPIGHGDIDEELGGCLSSDETFSVWYSFTIETGGTLTFEIVPNNQGDDYDFGVFGPNKPCGNLGGPIRCSYSGASGNTGLSLTATDTTEGAGGDKWVKYLDVLPGQTYYIVINNHRKTDDGFQLAWGGTASLSSPFTDPNVQPYPFNPPGLPAANPADPREVTVCTNPAVFNFSSLTTGILNGNPHFRVTYHYNQNDALIENNPILAPVTINTTDIYYYSISYTDPTNPDNPINKCRQTGKFKFKDGTIVVNDATLTLCNNNNAGTATFDLTTANVYDDPTATKQYYPTMFDLNAGTNEITGTSIYQYVSAEGKIFVKVTSQFGCIDTAEITLKFHPVVTVTDTALRTCFLETNPSLGTFNLTNANVTTVTGAVKKYYPSATDAVDGTNEILDPLTYTAPTGVVYVKVFNAQGCYNIAKVTLTVIAPVKSNVLEDKIICIEDTTTLDAGPGFASYEWSTGATTQSISNVGVGTYWVKLNTGGCITLQTVKVYASEQPVVSSIDITSNTITVNVIGGTPDYKYSMDNINWQDSNIFTNLSRGDHKVYVKDAYDCDPIEIGVVVPNLVNVITPNGDGINDVIDYSAMAGKQNLVFSIFDRYGAKIHQADKNNGFTWDGTVSGRRLPTGTYWYSVTWNENDKKNTPFKFSGWVMLKNRE